MDDTSVDMMPFSNNYNFRNDVKTTLQIWKNKN